MPPETGNIEPNTPLAAYRAYYELIESKIEEYGVGYNDGGFYEGEFESYWRGVYRGIIHAELIDFNNDGLPELVIIYNNGIGLGADLWSIYGYTESIEKYYEAYSGGDGGSSYDISIAVSSDGIRYLDCYEGYVVYDYEIFEHYYTVRDGAWVTALSRSFAITSESRFDYDREEYEWEWLVNGISVSENEYNAAEETELGIISTESIPISFRYVYDLGEANEIAFDVVYAMLAELGNRISQLES